MTKRRRSRKLQPPPPRPAGPLMKLLPKLLAGLMATGAVGGTTLAYQHGGVATEQAVHADERAAKLEVRVGRVEQDAGMNTRDIKRIDRRTTRTETMMELMLDKAGVPEHKRPPRDYGPERE